MFKKDILTEVKNVCILTFCIPWMVGAGVCTAVRAVKKYLDGIYY